MDCLRDYFDNLNENIEEKGFESDWCVLDEFEISDGVLILADDDRHRSIGINWWGFFTAGLMDNFRSIKYNGP